MNNPTLYTFRRCPYAIRARLALRISGVTVNEIEVKLSDKPAAMLALSPKGSVPVLQLTDGKVIDESLDIMRWALAQHDPDSWLSNGDEELIHTNDVSFKRTLDQYKYPERFPEHPQHFYRNEASLFLSELNVRLSTHKYLCGEKIALADAAIFPFVRQFVAVDSDWFNASTYSSVRRWHDEWQASTLFQDVIKK